MLSEHVGPPTPRGLRLSDSVKTNGAGKARKAGAVARR